MENVNYFMVRPINNSEKCVTNFTNNSIVAVGWSDINFSEQNSSKEIFNKLPYLKDMAPQAAGRHRSQIDRFLNIRENDRILVPHWDSICLALARNQRKYNESTYEIDQSNELFVEYLKDSKGEILSIPRDSISEGLQRRIRVRGMTISDLNEFYLEIENLFEVAKKEKTAYSWKDGIEEIRCGREKTFKASLLKNIQSGNTNLKTGGIGLERLILELIESEGYKAYILGKQTFPSFADADVVAVKADRFVESKLLFQVKHHSGISDSWGIEQLLEIKKQLPEIYKSHKLVFVTSADVGSTLIEKAENNDVVVLNGIDLVDWIYDSLKKISNETKYKLGIIEFPETI